MPFEQLNEKLSYLISSQTQLSKKMDNLEQDRAYLHKALESIIEILTSKLPEADKILRVKEVVSMLGVSRSTVHRLTEANTLPSTHLEGIPFYLRSEIFGVFKKADDKKEK